MTNPNNLVQVQGVKRITEMGTYPSSLSGNEEILIDSGDFTYKITVDSLLGYIVDKIAGPAPNILSNTLPRKGIILEGTVDGASRLFRLFINNEGNLSFESIDE